VLSQLI